MAIGYIFETELTKKRLTCAHCGYTWMELAGLIIERRQESEGDVHFRIGDVPCLCHECGCDLVYEIGLSEKAQQGEIGFEGIKRIVRECTET